MRILGIDPGIALVGWGVIDSDRGRFSVVDFGCIKTTSDMSTEDRLKSVYDQLDEIIEKYKNFSGIPIKRRVSSSRKREASSSSQRKTTA